MKSQINLSSQIQIIHRFYPMEYKPLELLKTSN